MMRRMALVGALAIGASTFGTASFGTTPAAAIGVTVETVTSHPAISTLPRVRLHWRFGGMAPQQ